MANNIENEQDLPLSEFVKLPTTVSFHSLNTERLQQLIKEHPYIRIGTVFATGFVVGYMNQAYATDVLSEVGNNFLYFLPQILSPTDSQSNNISGITQVQNQPFLNLSGRGVIIGFVDTGIDYRKDAFKFEDGSTKILGIWDQTIDGSRPDDLYFGSTYTSEDINNANASQDPYSIVPSIDEDGHGTFLASVAAGNETGEYIGAAPKANLLIVKLKRASQFYIDRYLLPNEIPNLYESTDYMLGIKYIINAAEKFNMPFVICIGMGTNTGAHDGSTVLEEFITAVSQRVGSVFVTGAGNEANAKHHTLGKIRGTGETDQISIKVGEQGASFTVIIISPGFDKISVGITSPTGEAVSRVSFRSGLEYKNQLVLENTEIIIRYFRDTNNNVIISLKNATEGIWNIVLYGELVVDGQYWAWLPITGQISPAVEFMRPNPEYTIVIPSTSLRSIKCGAYNSEDQSLLVSSSWGPIRTFRVAPDFVAPGANVKGIYPTGQGTMTGTSVATAVTSGITALLLEWGIVNGKSTAMDADLIRSLLISGCQREKNLTYPNFQWGYGRVNLYRTFEIIKESALDFDKRIEEGDF